MKHTKTIFFISVLFLMIISSLCITSATITTEVNKFKVTSSGDFNKVDFRDISIRYYLSTGEDILINSRDKGKFIFEPSKEIFCWEGCNIYPSIYIYKEDINENGELLSRQDLTFGNSEKVNLGQVINVYVDSKINSQDTNNLDSRISNQIGQSFGQELNDFIVNWNGTLIVYKEGNYNLFLNVSGGVKLSIDNISLIDDWQKNTNGNFRKQGLSLSEGNHSVSITYWSNKEYNHPNMLWESDELNLQPIPQSNLLFETGGSRDYDRGDMLSKSSNSPSYNIDYVQYPSGILYYYSITNDRRPLLLVHGMNGDVTSDFFCWGVLTNCNSYWNLIPYQFSDAGYDVWMLQYTPANVSNFMTSGLLKNEINQILFYYPQLSDRKIDVLSHSMGGLVTLGYIENLGKGPSQQDITYGNNIRKYAMIGGPIHGSYLANRVLRGESAGIVCGWIVDPKDPNAQAYNDLAIGSDFTWLLNNQPLNSDINYLSITGNMGIPCIPDETKEGGDGEPDAGNDGLVAISSTSLLNKDVPLIILDGYNHRNEIGATTTGLSDSGYSQKIVNVADSFLKNLGISNLKSKLSAYDIYIDPSNSLTNPYHKGAIQIKVSSLGSVNSVQIKNIVTNKFYELSYTDNDSPSRLGTHVWYYFNRDSSDVDYGLTLPSGMYAVYVNGSNINQNIGVKGAQTMMKTINLIPEPTCFTPINGSYYNIFNSTKLCNGSYFSGQSFFYIGSSNIVFDCDGSTLIGGPYGDGFVLMGSIWGKNLTNITIKNCVMKNQDDGINVMSPASGISLLNNYILNSSVGIRLYQVNNVTIQDSNFANNSIAGIIIQESNYDKVINNKFSNNGVASGNNVGLFITNSFGNVILNNYFFVSGISDDKQINNTYCVDNNDNLYYNGASGPICSCIPNWVQNLTGGSCLINDLRYKDWVDINSCNNLSTKPSPINQSCDYCNYSLAYTSWTDWKNQSSCSTKLIIQNRSRLQYDSNYSSCYAVTNLSSDLWNDGKNKTSWEFRNLTCDSCTPNLVNSSWSSWQNISCQIDDKMNQSRFLTQFDNNSCGEVENKTFIEYRTNQSCNFCSQNIQDPFYTDWSTCSEQQETKTRTKYFTDLNYESCCLVTNLTSDCSIRNQSYKNVTESFSCINLSLTINNPQEKIYNLRAVRLEIFSNKNLTKLEYREGNSRYWTTLCTRCKGVNKTLSFIDGQHNISIRAFSTDKQNITYEKRFFIDSTKPRIIQSYPSLNSFTNGSLFYVKYSEINSPRVIFNISNMSLIRDCPAGLNKNCSFENIALESYDNKPLNYTFMVFDVANNSAQIKVNRVIVDTTSPIINSVNITKNRNYFKFRINVTELNFNSVSYYDSLSSYPRWNILCTTLTNKICDRTVYLANGNHSITIRAVDKAGNSAVSNVTYI